MLEPIPDLEVQRLASLIVREAAGCSPFVWLTIAWVYGSRRNLSWSGLQSPMIPWDQIPAEIREVSLYWSDYQPPFPEAHFVMTVEASLDPSVRYLTWDQGYPLWIEGCKGGTAAIFRRVPPLESELRLPENSLRSLCTSPDVFSLLLPETGVSRRPTARDYVKCPASDP